MTDFDQLSWEILNATADDCENLEQIYGMVCAVPCFQSLKGSCLLSEVGHRIRELVRSGLLVIELDENGTPWKDQNDASYVWRGWFRITPAGRQAWQASQHFADVAKENA